MNRSFPCIKVCDMETSINWYEHFLGFTCSYKSSIKNPERAVMENKEIKIFLVEDPLRESYASNIVVIETSDIEAEFSKANDSGAIFRSPIEEGAFGGKEFAIKDYEDNTIIFRQNA